jgi:TPR repeat protein
MSVRAIRGAVAAAAVSITAAAHADFRAALEEYRAGHYEAARAQFLALAELGDCSSQFNLGAMALKGEGGPKDEGSAAGWLRSAAGNGCEPLVGSTLAGLEKRLDAAQSRSASAIVARYGRETLREQGIVDPDFLCRGETPASVLESPTPELPRLDGGAPREAIVITALTIGVDGLARDPEILLAVPQKGYAAAAVESWLNSRFTPASRGGVPVASRLQARLVFGVAGGKGLAEFEPLRSARERADAGEREAAYTAGLAATLDPSLGLSPARAVQLLLSAARDGESRAQYWVGAQLRATSDCHPRANGAVWLRHAAEGGSAAARLMIAEELLAGSPSAAQAGEARTFLEQASDDDGFYVGKHVAARLATSPLDAVRDPPTALKVALGLAAGQIQCDPQMFETVAAAYAANGDFRHATAEQRIAIRKAEALGWNTRSLKDRLAAYRAERPWRGDLLASPPPSASPSAAARGGL